MELPDPEQYRSCSLKAMDIQALNTKLFYNTALLKRTPTKSVLVYLVSNDDLVLHSIYYLALQRVNMKNNMVHSVIMAFGLCPTIYVGNI